MSKRGKDTIHKSRRPAEPTRASSRIKQVAQVNYEETKSVRSSSEESEGKFFGSESGFGSEIVKIEPITGKEVQSVKWIPP